MGAMLCETSRGSTTLGMATSLIEVTRGLVGSEQ
jgi:hypothetical protein